MTIKYFFKHLFVAQALLSIVSLNASEPERDSVASQSLSSSSRSPSTSPCSSPSLKRLRKFLSPSPHHGGTNESNPSRNTPSPFKLKTFLIPTREGSNEIPTIKVSRTKAPQGRLSEQIHRRAINLGLVSHKTIEMGGTQYRETKEIEGSKNTKKISFIEDPETKKTMVVKYYIDSNAYESEKQTEQNDKLAIEEYGLLRSQFLEQYPDEVLPILPKILAYDVTETDFGKCYLMFMEGAKGESLRTLISETVWFQYTKYTPDFKSMGRQFGNIYRMLNKVSADIKPMRRHLVHFDPNMGNFIYNKLDGTLTWIDLPGISFDDYDDSNGFKYGTELNILLFVRDMINAAANYQSSAERNNATRQQKLKIKKSVEIIKTHQAFFNDYKGIVDTCRALPLTLEFIFNSDLEKKNEKGELFYSYKGFLSILDNIESSYQKITGETIDLYGGYGLENPKEK